MCQHKSAVIATAKPPSSDPVVAERCKCRGEGCASAVTHVIAGTGRPMVCVFHAATGLVGFRECGQGLLPSNTNNGKAPASAAGAGGAVGPADGAPAAVSMGSSTTVGAAPAAAAGNRVGSATVIASATPPSPGRAPAAERRRGQRGDDRELLDKTVEQLAEEFRDVVNTLKVHARREDISLSRAWVRARADNYKSSSGRASSLSNTRCIWRSGRAYARASSCFGWWAFTSWQPYSV